MTDTDKNSDKWEAQLRKGTLELVILALLQQRTLYGLELLKQLQQYRSTAISEGTLYPLLDRLKRDDLIDAVWVQEHDTRPRKYYSLAPAGVERLAALLQLWRQSVADIEQLLSPVCIPSAE
ncbi:PadR family transcriptional regulator [Rheinheimera sp.]|uniref:PadR family transcriptional regulator n=1 Tax=Rheinheimera sp. TaxID=1869214 RepID=UPI00307DADA1